MSGFCIGLAVLGLCLPVPGHSVASLSKAGWVNNSEEAGAWFSASIFAANSYQLGVSVESDLTRVTSVWLREVRPSDREATDSPLRRALTEACGVVKEGKPCRYQGHSFWRVECAGGWLLYSTNMSPDRQQLKERCRRSGEFLK